MSGQWIASTSTNKRPFTEGGECFTRKQGSVPARSILRKSQSHSSLNSEKPIEFVKDLDDMCPTSEEQFMILEKRWLEVAQQLSNIEPSDGLWRAKLMIPQVLLNGYFGAFQHLSSIFGRKNIPPARMWHFGIKPTLDALYHHLPTSKEHLTTFITFAFSGLKEVSRTAEEFKEIWLECLGDLARYRMAIEEVDLDERTMWTGIAREWYLKADDATPGIGRIQHHIAILGRPDILQQLFYYTKALISVHPFRQAEKTILLLFKPLLERKTTYEQHPAVVEFVRAHGYLYTEGVNEQFLTAAQKFLLNLRECISQSGAAFRLQGVYITACNLAAISGYGKAIALLPAEFLNIVCQTLSIILNETEKENVYPSLHITLAFVWCSASNGTGVEHFETAMPWRKICNFLNEMIMMDGCVAELEKDTFPIPEKGKQMPEDFLIRGQLWSQKYYPGGYFDEAPTHYEERSMENPTLNDYDLRRYRCLWLGIRIAYLNRWITYESAEFSTTTSAIKSDSHGQGDTPFSSASTMGQTKV